MHLNKNHTISRRALAMLLTLTLCFSLVPSAFAAQQNSYHDPAEHWMQASNRTNELDVNSVVTRETFKCGECGKVLPHDWDKGSVLRRRGRDDRHHPQAGSAGARQLFWNSA